MFMVRSHNKPNPNLRVESYFKIEFLLGITVTEPEKTIDDVPERLREQIRSSGFSVLTLAQAYGLPFEVILKILEEEKPRVDTGDTHGG